LVKWLIPLTLSLSPRGRGALLTTHNKKKGDGSIFIISFCLKEINSISKNAPGRKVKNRDKK